MSGKITSAYLADAMVIATPRAMGTLGKLRELTAGYMVAGVTPGHETEAQLRDLKTLLFRFNIEDEDLLRSLERARSNNEKSAQPVTDHREIIEPQLKEFRGKFDALVFQHKKIMPAADFSEMMTE